MTWMGLKYSSPGKLKLSEIESDLTALVSEFAEILKKKYDIVEYQQNGKTVKCFKISDDQYIYPACMYGGTDNAFHNLVIVYSDSIERILRHDEEEGGQFFPEDFDSKESMFNSMLEEIEGR